MPERSADPGGSRGCPKMHKAAAVLGALAVTSLRRVVRRILVPEPVLAPRCVESASFRAAALRVPTADPPDPGSLPLRQELAQLRAEGLRGAGGRPGIPLPGSKKGRCWPPSPAEAGATRSSRGRYMYFGDILLVDRPRGRYKPSAGLILSIGRESPRKPSADDGT